jgi:DNA invertase Pin-like site-specific DNA recombinase
MKFISFTRVSTTRQGLDGYGMAAQAEIIENYVKSVNGELLASFKEVQSGGASENNRPILKEAISTAKALHATLVFAKLDRMCRTLSYLVQLQASGIDFVFCDNPHANKLTINILAVIAQNEREMISSRTCAGLAIAKSRGVKLGNPRALEALPVARLAIQERKKGFAQTIIKYIQEIQSTGISSLNRIADCLNKRGETTRRGCKWTPTAVQRIISTLS